MRKVRWGLGMAHRNAAAVGGMPQASVRPDQVPEWFHNSILSVDMQLSRSVVALPSPGRGHGGCSLRVLRLSPPCSSVLTCNTCCCCCRCVCPY